jgi:hypothetical protein
MPSARHGWPTGTDTPAAGVTHGVCSRRVDVLSSPRCAWSCPRPARDQTGRSLLCVYSPRGGRWTVAPRRARSLEGAGCIAPSALRKDAFPALGLGRCRVPVTRGQRLFALPGRAAPSRFRWQSSETCRACSSKPRTTGRAMRRAGLTLSPTARVGCTPCVGGPPVRPPAIDIHIACAGHWATRALGRLASRSGRKY